MWEGSRVKTSFEMAAPGIDISVRVPRACFLVASSVHGSSQSRPLRRACSGKPAFHRAWSWRQPSLQPSTFARNQASRVLMTSTQSEAVAIPEQVVKRLESIRGEIENLADGQVDQSIYLENVRFQDPLNRFSGIRTYVKNIEFLGVEAEYEVEDNEEPKKLLVVSITKTLDPNALLHFFSCI